jgi:AcrR family transcriptional regulator
VAAVRPTTVDDLRVDAARNRAQVLEVARELLAAGDATLPMNTIARLAGVGVGTVYRHFPTRQALLESAVMGSFEQLLAEARAAAADDDPGAGLERLLRYGIRRQLSDVGLAAVLRSSESACARTSRLRADLLEAVGRGCWSAPARPAPFGRRSGPTTSGFCRAASCRRCGQVAATKPRSNATRMSFCAASAPVAESSPIELDPQGIAVRPERLSPEKHDGGRNPGRAPFRRFVL